MRSALDKFSSHNYMWLRATLWQESQCVDIRIPKEVVTVISTLLRFILTAEIMRDLIRTETAMWMFGFGVKIEHLYSTDKRGVWAGQRPFGLICGVCNKRGWYGNPQLHQFS